MPSKMVFNQISGESTEQQQGEEKIAKKIFTCTEIEENNNDAMKSNSTKNLEHDPAVLFSSSSQKMTRYDKAELMKMQDLHLSRQKPPCFYNLAVMRLNILKVEERADQEYMIQDRIKMLQENLQTLQLQNWNSSIYHNYKSYQYALLNPFSNPLPSPPQTTLPSVPLLRPLQQQQEEARRRRVSFDMDQQQAALDKILTYDRKTVFFDTLTTTTTMRPNSRAPNINNNNNSLQSSRRSNSFARPAHETFENVHRKSFGVNGLFSTNKERYVPPANSVSFPGPGYFSATGYNTQMESGRNTEKCAENDAAKEEVKKQSEVEPEWFSFPATRHDFVDLHGFTEEHDAALKESSPAKEQSPTYGGGKRSQIPRFNKNPQSCNVQQQQRQYQNNNAAHLYQNSRGQVFNRGPNNNSFNGSGFQNNSMGNISNNNSFQANGNNQRFRNPLHQSKSMSPNTPTLPPAAYFGTNTIMPGNLQQHPQPMNPFYETWKSSNAFSQRNLNFAYLMQQANNARQMPPTMKSMSEVEQCMIQNSQLPLNVQPPAPGNIQQFFQNFSDGGNSVGANRGLIAPPGDLSQQQMRTGDMFALPTREQLQQHTSEILRNAILRNRESQHYHDETNHQPQQ